MIPDDLFILEMANNHMGDLDHGLAIVRAHGAVCREFPFRIAFKLQYRDLDTFIHPAARGRNDIKYVKRFSETRLSRADFDHLVAEMRSQGFLVAATPFDEPSVDVIDEQGLDFIKIASCSFTDWPLLERVVRSARPIIASTAGASLEEMDRVISFLMHRSRDFAIMHCVGEYPTPDEHLHLAQIDFLRARYPGVRIGFSTHESPDHTDVVKLAIAKGVDLFEKHVGLPTERYPLNAYSAAPEQVRNWLVCAQRARTICGVGDVRLPPNPDEAASLRSLRRGVFARRAIAAGDAIADADVYFAFPPQEDQLTANEWSKYSVFTATADITTDAALTHKSVGVRDQREKIWQIAQQVKAMLDEAQIAVPGSADLEISHHYGLDDFERSGLVLITVVNRGYCKKLLVSLPGQEHPEQWHNEKEETFHILRGEVHLRLDGELRHCGPGDVITVEPGVRHSFVSPTGAIIEEISTTHNGADSFYTDERINRNTARKTLLTYWMG
jgi:sialic acid synthase SpsE/mannose-6-phosphate isomerase-like protein (cupin superfamily)